MINLKFDMKQIDVLKDLIVRLRDGESEAIILNEVEEHFKDVAAGEILLIQYELLQDKHKISVEDIRQFSKVSQTLIEKELLQIEDLSKESGHPVQIFKEEIQRFYASLKQITDSLDLIVQGDQKIEEMAELIKDQMSRFEGLNNHFNRKEKLLFPIMERHGHYTLPRMMWKNDDYIRDLYRAAIRRMGRMPNVDMKLIQKTFVTFKQALEDMLFQEEMIVLPIVVPIFNDRDWQMVAEESDAFGYAFDLSEDVQDTNKYGVRSENKKVNKMKAMGVTTENLPFGGGFLTINEANQILNHLPLEITFVDKNSVFKYFNEKNDEEPMILVRTPTSVGRNVSNCHPPKSLKKVMRLVRDLKSKKRASEKMWFKKGDSYVHITYTAVFDEEGDYLGILECVQDIQPFLDLPRDVKKGLSVVEE